MQYPVNSPSEYFDALDNDWRKDKLLQVRDLILKYGSDLSESIEYKMLAFGMNGKNIFHLNAQSAYVSLYVGTINKVDGADKMLKEFNKGKGCIRIKKSVNIDETGLEEFIEKTIDIWRDGGETDC